MTVSTFDPFSPDTSQHVGGSFHGESVTKGSYGFAVLSHEASGKVLRNIKFQNSALRLMEEFGITKGPIHEFRGNSVIMQEGPNHLRLRTPLARFMNPITVERTRSVLQDLAGEIFDEIQPATTVEFHDQVGRRIPSMVYCHLAGAPKTDAPKVQELSEGTLALLTRDKSLTPSILAAYEEVFAYLSDLIQRKRDTGLGEDMLSYLIQISQEGKLTEQELVTEATSMLEASSVNTAHQISLVVWTLLQHRDVWNRLVQDNSLIPAAIVEAIRLYPRTGVISKIATEDLEVDGTLIPEGSDVHVAVWSANRDPERFDDPEVFDLDRERNQPLTFSTGPHNCLGQGLAKAEIEEIVTALVQRYPNARIVDDKTSVGQKGGRWLVDSLTIDLEPGS